MPRGVERGTGSGLSAALGGLGRSLCDSPESCGSDLISGTVAGGSSPEMESRTNRNVGGGSLSKITGTDANDGREPRLPTMRRSGERLEDVWPSSFQGRFFRLPCCARWLRGGIVDMIVLRCWIVAWLSHHEARIVLEPRSEHGETASQSHASGALRPTSRGDPWDRLPTACSGGH